MQTASILKMKYGLGASFVFVTCMVIYLSNGNTSRLKEVQVGIYNTVSNITRDILNKMNNLLSEKSKSLDHVIVVFNPDYSSPLKYYNETLANRCAFKNCRLTTNRSNLRNQSAILFFLSNAPSLPPKPPVSRSERDPNQVWIFSWLESPIHHWGGQNIYGNKHWQNTANWTMSYIKDADIDLPYGHLIKQAPPFKNYSDIFRRKTKVAAWVVSHCQVQSKREIYVEKMKQAGIDVDIFGRCSGKRVEHDFIRHLIDREYKFYLSFENSFCKDYITEKFFSYYQLDIIPVVRGGGNYSNTSADRTYINTADFSSIKELGDYLHKVASSEELYTEYLRNKDKYASPERLEIRHDNYCEICKRLNDKETYRKSYTNLAPIIHNGTCFEPNDIH